MAVTIWHNPRCSKSRQTLALIEEQGITPIVRLYLEDSPRVDEIKAVIKILDCTPRQIMRKNEIEYSEQKLSSKDNYDLITAMVKTPKLIERPIVINGDKAAIGRPPENVLAIL